MPRFIAEVTDNQSISIISDTYWSCKSEGNFKLSKYSGFGNDTIDVIIPDDIMYSEGVVYFSYGDGKCEYPPVNIYYTNNCYIETQPSYIACDGEKSITFYFNQPNEVFYVYITCYGGWEAEASSTNISFININGGIMVISGENEGEVLIAPNNDCDEKNVIHIKLKKALISS